MSTTYLITKMLSVPAVLLALVFHECAHGYTAYKLGDPTAKNMGRLTLNPLAHLDPIGAILMLLVGFGWARPVPVNPRYFKNPRKGMALTALMGPVANILIAIISALLYLLMYKLFLVMSAGVLLTRFWYNFLYYLTLFFLIMHRLNLSLAIFNLIPLPPLDGSRILGLFLPQKWYYWLLTHERQIAIIFFVWLLVGDGLATYLLALPAVASSPVLAAIVNIFSLSGWLGSAVQFLSNLIIGLFTKIPFLAI